MPERVALVIIANATIAALKCPKVLPFAGER
jgi:hypothetical protein